MIPPNVKFKRYTKPRIGDSNNQIQVKVSFEFKNQSLLYRDAILLYFEGKFPTNST